VCRLLVTASVVPSSRILFTLMKEALSSFETSVLTRVAWRNIQEDTILHLPDSSYSVGQICFDVIIYSDFVRAADILFLFCNPILFEICASTFSTLCKNLCSGI
jgi:hypothetical protein